MWDLAAQNYTGLKKVKTKLIDFGQYKVKVQFNPARIISSSANVDAQSIAARTCFLCRKNLPRQQSMLLYDNDFFILVNPYPIFLEHLTIPAYDHIDQQINKHFGKLLDLSFQMQDFVIFYNGPKCGASAPDHLHFQAGIKGFLPIETDFLSTKCCQPVRSLERATIFQWPDYQRGIISIKSKFKELIIHYFNQIVKELQFISASDDEPLLNILAYWENSEYVTHIIPRKLHRPKQFYESGNQQILISPASVDMGGVLITPREEDFTKLSKDDVSDIFNQVSFGEEEINNLIHRLNG